MEIVRRDTEHAHAPRATAPTWAPLPVDTEPRFRPARTIAIIPAQSCWWFVRERRRADGTIFYWRHAVVAWCHMQDLEDDVEHLEPMVVSSIECAISIRYLRHWVEDDDGYLWRDGQTYCSCTTSFDEDYQDPNWCLNCGGQIERAA